MVRKIFDVAKKIYIMLRDFLKEFFADQKKIMKEIYEMVMDGMKKMKAEKVDEDSILDDAKALAKTVPFDYIPKVYFRYALIGTVAFSSIFVMMMASIAYLLMRNNTTNKKVISQD
jgi:hypothetical protein